VAKSYKRTTFDASAVITAVKSFILHASGEQHNYILIFYKTFNSQEHEK
jgi:hypothetical protein